MNLKYFHIFFITIASILVFGVAYSEYQAYRDGGTVDHLHVAQGWAAAGVVLLGYGVYFYQKAKRIIV